jgi:hypothetical protein
MGSVLMADTLLQNLTELTSPVLTDLLYMVADPAGTPLDRKVQFSTVLDRAKGYSTILDASGKGDYTDLATALAALSAGDVLFIRNGTYAGGVTIATAGVTIIGETRNGVIIQSPSNNATPCITISAANVTLQSFKIDGLRDTQGVADADVNDWSGIYVTADGALIDNVWVFEPYGHGIPIGANDGRITNCLVENRATNGVTPTAGKYFAGIIAYAGSRWTIAYNRVTGFSQGIGLWWGCDDNVIALNKIVANYGYITGAAPGTRSAIEDYGAGEINYRNLWIGNLIDGATSECIECAQGVVGSQFISNVCRNANIFADNTGRGFTVTSGDATEPTRDIILRNNTFVGSGIVDSKLTGGHIFTLGAVTIEGNAFVDCRRGGIEGVLTATGANTRLILRGNTFRGCSGGAIRLAAQQPALIDGNTATDLADTSAVFYIEDSANSIGHVITDNYVNGDAIAIYVAKGKYHRITQNTHLNCTWVSIAIGAPHCIVTHNYVQGSDSARLINVDTVAGTIIKHNIVVSNSSQAIYLYTCTGSVVQENTLIGTPNGVTDDTGTGNQITPNHTGTFSRIVGVLKSLGAQTVNGTQATIAHDLAYTPTQITIQMTSAGTIWKSAASDGTNIYLTADDAGRTAEVFVR